MGGFNSGGFTPSRIETPDLEVDDGTLSVDTGNNRVGIGTTEPSAPCLSLMALHKTTVLV